MSKKNKKRISSGNANNNRTSVTNPGEKKLPSQHGSAVDDNEGVDIAELKRRYGTERADSTAETVSEHKNMSEDDLMFSLDKIKKEYESENYDDDTNFLYQAPDAELFEDISKDGNACDVKSDSEKDIKGDTREAPKIKIEGLLSPEQLMALQKKNNERTGTFSVKKDSQPDTEKNTNHEDTKNIPELNSDALNALKKLYDNADNSENGTDGRDEKNGENKKTRPDFSELKSKFQAVKKKSLEIVHKDTADAGNPEKRIKIDDYSSADIFGDEHPEDDLIKIFDGDIKDDDTDIKLYGGESTDGRQSKTKKVKTKKTFPENESVENEYISPSDKDKIFENYKKLYGKSVVKLIIIAFITLILFLYENTWITGGHIFEIFEQKYYPVVNAMAGLQILFIGFAVMYKNVRRGVIGIVNKRPIADSLLLPLFIISAMYGISVCFFENGTVFSTFYFPASLCLLLSAFAEKTDLRREIQSFSVIASNSSKYVIKKLDYNDSEVESRVFGDYIHNHSDIFKVTKTTFIDGFFRRSRAYPSGKILIGAMIPVSLFITFVSFFICLFGNNGGEAAIKTAYLVFSFTFPATAFLSFCIPMSRVTDMMYDEKCTLIGETALDEYTSASAISFDDTSVFPTTGVGILSFKLFGGNDYPDKVMYYLSGVYSIIGGPLNNALDSAVSDYGKPEKTEVINIENEGVEALADGHHLYAGRAAYIKRLGFTPEMEDEDADVESDGVTRVMYLVADDVLFAKIYLQYPIDPNFESTLKTLYKGGICVGIKTADPNINDEMLSACINLTKYPVRVVKYSNVNRAVSEHSRADSGIVSRKGERSLLRSLILCDKTRHIIKTDIVLNFVSVIAGIIIALAVMLIRKDASVKSLYVGLYQIFWTVAVYLLSKFMLI